ncbi:regulator of (H+)-ATPase in vacuolar membrane [Coniosporium apollinis]|uniref:Regulator of (H+)-ATPase in vacuolar membrane n=1 Tax=Coniosporium apollinis TaxID=61459 RepID=A0ABQ9P465_9PEZI|nr:regulator of (H+)-ATPase in vacuolar membrane [Coniosporium apollinis]
MRAILPGRPQAKLQALTTGFWRDRQILAYVSGNALIVLDGPNHVLQTTYHTDPCHLVTVTFDEATGKLATCSTAEVHIYQPYGQEEGEVKWSLQNTLNLPEKGDEIRTLSWGTDEELLVGSTSSLTLISTHNGSELQWSNPIASPPKFAQFSPDASFIASTSTYDKLVKIWRRSSFGRFDVAYLRHPTTITGLHWRRPWHREQTLENVLYTICGDGKVRVWTPTDHRSLDIMGLWTTIDCAESIKPRRFPNPVPSEKRYAFVIDSRDFTAATERAVEQADNRKKGRDQHALEHLIAVANRSPEVIVVLDDQGNMSAWGLESIGCKARKKGDVFNVAHVEGLKLSFNKEAEDLESNVQFYNFCDGKKGEQRGLTVLAHHFDGRIEWWEGRIDRLFDVSPNARRLDRRAVWTGHSSAIKKVVRTATGRALVSRTDENEGVVWVQRVNPEGRLALVRHSTIDTAEHIHRVWLLQEGDFVAFLHHDSVSLWDSRGAKAVEVARCQYNLKGKPLCLILIPETEANSGCVHIATITSEMKGAAWEVRIPPKKFADTVRGARYSIVDSTMFNSYGRVSLEDFCTFDLGSGDDLAFVLPVDPAGTPPAISGFLDIFARDVAISYTRSGVLKSWTARVDVENRKIEWLQTSTVETGVENPFLASSTSIRKAALIDSSKTGLTIWNTRSGQLEHEERFEGHGDMQDLDWSSTPDNQSILAVGFPHRVLVYAQLRYDYLNAGPSWTAVRQISTRELTPHPIGDSVWLGSGNLVIGAGNQLFVQDEYVEISDSLLPDLRTVSRKNAALDIFTVVSRLNGPLPVFHPQLLAQCILAGKLLLVQRILIDLYKALKFYTEGDDLDSFLGFQPEDFYSEHEVLLNASKKEMHSSYADFSDDEEPDSLTEDVATSLNELLMQKSVPQLTSREQFHLADIVECVGTVEKHRRSVDDNASRFLLFFRQHVLRATNKTSDPTPLSWREITWAFFSTSQDILLDLISRHFHNRMHWPSARSSGIFMWLTDRAALLSHFETIARNEYVKSEDKNPVDCSLYYLALKKKAVLLGLWRMATWSREQGATYRLLSNDFSQPRWKTAALKNAYALMGKRRFEYAAAFFLLADQLQDAVSVLSNQLGDQQLAIAVARVYEGDDGPVLRRFLEDKILPQAASEGNRWQACWAFWMLGRRDKAVRALVSPLSSLMSPPTSPKQGSKSFLTDDPALVVLYRQLRERSQMTLKGAVMVAGAEEWGFVMHTARLYERMGCDLLALDLVRTWEFLAPPPQPLAPLPTKMPSHSQRGHQQTYAPSALDGYDIDPRKLLRRRSSLVVADLPTREAIKAASIAEDGETETDGEVNGASKEEMREAVAKVEEKRKPPPTQFQEPDANSLLDSFGF